MSLPNDQGEPLPFSAELFDQLMTQFRVLLDQRAFLRGQLPRLRHHGLRDGKQPDVMNQSGQREALQFFPIVSEADPTFVARMLTLIRLVINVEPLGPANACTLIVAGDRPAISRASADNSLSQAALGIESPRPRTSACALSGGTDLSLVVLPSQCRRIEARPPGS